MKKFPNFFKSSYDQIDRTMSDDIITSSTNVIMGIIISVVLVCSALIPIVIDQITSLTDTNSPYSSFEQLGTWTNLLEIVVVIVIIGLIIGVVRTYARTGRELD